MQFLANENIPVSAIRRLRKEGHTVIAIIEESPESDDPTVVARARQKNALLLTFDRDYGELIFRHRLLSPAGVVYLRFIPASPEEPAEILSRLLQEDTLSLEEEFTVVERPFLRLCPLF